MGYKTLGGRGRGRRFLMGHVTLGREGKEVSDRLQNPRGGGGGGFGRVTKPGLSAFRFSYRFSIFLLLKGVAYRRF